MMAKAICSVFGKVVAALVSLAFLLAPMASAAHVETAPETVCAAEDGAEHAAGAEDAGHEGHQHHAHGCGTCHVHLIGPACLLIPSVEPARMSLRPLMSDGAESSAPGGLFRPPRG